MGKAELGLALDLGLHTGFAVHDDKTVTLSGVWHLAGMKCSGWGARFVNLVHQLNSLYQVHPFHAVSYEEVRRHLGTTAAHNYGGFLAHICSWCEGMGIPYEGVPVGTIKKHATGKGTADKFVMTKAALKKWPGVDFGSEDEVDARWLADYVVNREGVER